MTPRSRTLTLLFGFSALVFSTWAAWVHHRLIVDPSYISPCDINATFSCSSLYLSRYGTVAGVPVALGGVIWSIGTLLLAGLAQTSDPARQEDATATYLFAWSTLGLASVLYFGYISSFVLKTFCVLCIGTYVSVLGTFIVTGLAATTPMLEIPVRLLRDLQALSRRPSRLLALALFLIGAAGLVAFFPREAAVVKAASSTPPAAQTPEADFLDSWSKQPRIDLGIPADGAKVVIVKFNDWQCPSCKAAHIDYMPLLDRYAKEQPGAIKYVLKDYPLNPKCNFNIAGGAHAGACEAAVAVRIARKLGKDKEDDMITWLYANQETLTPESVTENAQRILGITDFAKQYPVIINDVKRDVTDGGILHVNSTPTFYINGIHANTPDGRWLQSKWIDLAIQYEISHAKSGGK